MKRYSKETNRQAYSRTRMRTDNGKITIGFISFMLVMIKAILYLNSGVVCEYGPWERFGKI